MNTHNWHSKTLPSHTGFTSMLRYHEFALFNQNYLRTLTMNSDFTLGPYTRWQLFPKLKYLSVLLREEEGNSINVVSILFVHLYWLNFPSSSDQVVNPISSLKQHVVLWNQFKEEHSTPWNLSIITSIVIWKGCLQTVGLSGNKFVEVKFRGGAGLCRFIARYAWKELPKIKFC